MFIGCMCVTSSIGVADIWFDPTGDIATGNPNLDITSFEITDNGSDLLMTIEVADLSQATSLAGDTKGPISSGAVFGGGAPGALSNTEEWSSTSTTIKVLTD